MKRLIFTLAILSLTLMVNAQIERPTMGWSSWNTYRVNISDSLIMRQADAMVTKGLNKVGYKYVNIDDGYFGGRDKATGRLLIHSMRFPRGLKPVVEHIHRLGLKAGIYSDGGRNTCGSIYDADTIGVGVGLYGHDQQDCDMFFRELGFDFIKVDYCGGKPHPKGDTLNLDEQTRYTEIAEAIRRTGRKDVRLNVCRWDYPGTWVSNVAVSWRMSQDIRPRCSSVKDIIQQNLYLSAYAGGGRYNDMDMLEVGRGMTAEEDHTHFAVWCMMSSPLLIGCDLTNLKPETRNLLTDRQLIAINQDPLGLQAYVAKRVGECYVLVKDVKKRNGKERAVAFVNLSDKEQTMTLDLQDIDLEGDALTATLPPHATRVFIAKGKKRLQRRLYEAETAFLSSYQEIKNHQAFLTAIYEEDSRCSGGVKASWLGGRDNNDLRWRDVYVQKTGRYALRFNCLTNERRTIYIDVNGKTVDSLTFVANGEQTVFATLQKGRNEVRLWNASGRMPDVDDMIVDDAPVSFGKLTIEGRTEPLGLDDLHPRFGWQLVSGENDVRQTSYRIIVSSSRFSLLPPPSSNIWDSGEISSDSSQWIAYDSITPDVKMERHSRIAARHLRKAFTISKPVRRATAHVCGLGYYILNINDQRIGDYLLAPAPTQYDKAAIYDTYDVTSQIVNGKLVNGKSIDLPHDFQFEQPWTKDGSKARGFKPMCEGWYRKTFVADEAWKGLNVKLDFGGIICYGDVYINGQKVASTDYGYVGLEADLTKHLKWGESNGWPKKGWNFSFFDHTLQPYPTAWLVKSAFKEDEPVVRIGVLDAKGSESVSWNDIQVGQTSLLSHWNFEAGSKQRVYVFTNAPQAELLVNGKSLGMKSNDGKGNMQHVITWNVDYGKGGSVTAIARDANGKEMARHELQTAGKAVKLKIESDFSPLTSHLSPLWKADGMDLQYLNITAVDNKGRIVPDYDDELSVSVDGAAMLLALDNGDHYTDDLFAGITTKKMRGGKMQVILRSKREAGQVQVHAVSAKFKVTYKTATK